MGLIPPRILFGKKKASQTKAEPTKTSIDFTVKCIIFLIILAGIAFLLNLK